MSSPGGPACAECETVLVGEKGPEIPFPTKPGAILPVDPAGN